MSIRAQIMRHLGGELHELHNPLGSGRGPRRLFLATDVLPITQTEFWADDENGALYQEAYAKLEGYARHDHIWFALNPRKKHRSAGFARVHPIERGAISIRAWIGREHIRMFGCFAEMDWLVVLSWYFRDNVDDFGERARDCRERWDRLFAPLTPLIRGSTHDYLSAGVSPSKAPR